MSRSIFSSYIEHFRAGHGLNPGNFAQNISVFGFEVGGLTAFFMVLPQFITDFRPIFYQKSLV